MYSCIFSLKSFVQFCVNYIFTDCLVWEIATLASNTRVEDKYELRISCDHEPDHITGSKWENMRLDKHLQISIMAGIIDKLHGASNYASDRSDSSVATQTFVCRAKSREEHLDLQALENEEPLHLDMQNGKGQATHVVVSIFYGAEAYCVLTDDAGKQAKEKLASLWKSSLTRRQGLLEFNENFDSQEKLMHSDVKCRLYSDLLREAVLECGFFEAYEHCLDLITHVEDPNANNSVPTAVLLCPLEVILGSKKTMEQIYYDVNIDLVSRYCRICDKLEKIRAKAGAIGSAMVEKNRLRDFEEAIAKYQDILKTNIKDSVVKSRLTSVDEVKSIVEIAENHSLFKPSKLKRWLFYEEAELQMIEKITVDLDGIAVLANKKEFKSKSSEDKKFALVLRFPKL